MPYTADPLNVNAPQDSDQARYAAAELRAIKARLVIDKAGVDTLPAMVTATTTAQATADTALANAAKAQATAAAEVGATALANAAQAAAGTAQSTADANAAAIAAIVPVLSGQYTIARIDVLAAGATGTLTPPTGSTSAVVCATANSLQASFFGGRPLSPKTAIALQTGIVGTLSYSIAPPVTSSILRSGSTTTIGTLTTTSDFDFYRTVMGDSGYEGTLGSEGSGLVIWLRQQ